MKDSQIVEGEFGQVEPRPRREPVVGSWWGIPKLVAFFGLAYLMWHTIYPWLMAHTHIQLSDLLGRH